MTSKELAKKEITKLVQKFEDHKSDYRQAGYNETQTRRDFIDPFFKALGWDIDNEGSVSEAYRDVIHEDKVKVENRLKSPDYSFRLNGKRYFFVEAKKPIVNIKEDIDPAYQVKRYAWSAKLKLSIVTDFEEFAVYDCANKPKPNDKASLARIEYIKYDEYLEKFDKIWDVFSKEAVVNGGYDSYIAKDKKKGTTSVDDDFLESLDQWRTTLAKDIFKNNSKITEDHLNHVVQHTIDRIIFLRIAEDRNIELYGSIQNCLKQKDAYKSLYELFIKADEKYNSGLFNFEKDKISKTITISNKCLTEIVDNLYFPNSPYEFSVIPVEILGSAYEQFLGKTIQIEKGKIVVEEKPEVRKAGGVYYTPQYIVDYIVQNTVGKLIENKTPKEIEKIRVLDPASGSGSFLLGAYDFLLRYHIDWYSKNAKKSKGKKDDPLNPDGSLTTDIKKKILLNNIYGVDIDASAVEVTKLSLLLKCLEGETQASIKSQMNLFNERVLPTLDSNIKCGNSLVDTDFFEIESDRAILKKIKPFNWESNFPDVFKQGGFDAVIGNPPYVIIFELQLKKYLEEVYPSFCRNNDFYISFVEMSMKIFRQNGFISFIVPNTFLTGAYFLQMRLLMSSFRINEIVNFSNTLVFESANVFTSIFNIQNSPPVKEIKLIASIGGEVAYVRNEASGYIEKNSLIKKMEKLKRIDNFFIVKDVGYNYWSIGRGKKRGNSIGSRVLYYGKRAKKADIPFIKGKNINRYKMSSPENYLKYNYKEYLAENDIFRFSNEIMETIPKIVYRQTSSSIVASVDKNGYHNDKTVHIILLKPEFKFNIFYALGILNSKLTNYYYKNITNETGRAFAQVKVINIKKIPFINDPAKQVHDKIVEYVNKLLELNKSEEPDSAQIQYFENKIDSLVYELYGLTADEIKIIEEATSGNS